MKPIAQTFTVNETDVDGIYVKKVDLYFATKHATQGITVQLRYTENGTPTSEAGIVPLAEMHLSSSEVTVSDDASAATTFEFDAPIYLKNDVYALAIIPDSGNDGYELWVSKLSDSDVLTTNPIVKNNDTGALYLSGNDTSWTPVIDEDIKMTIHRCDFTAQTGTAVFTARAVEFVKIREKSFIGNMDSDIMYCGNDVNTAVIQYSNKTGTFNNGDYVYQNDGTANTAGGRLYSSNTTHMKIDSVTGNWSTGLDILDYDTAKSAQVTEVYQNVEVNSSSTTVSLPDASIFNVNDWIYLIDTNSRRARVCFITAKNQSVLPNTITLNYTTDLDDTSAIIGRIKGGAGKGPNTPGSVDHPLFAKWSGIGTGYMDYHIAMLTGSSANTTVNFYDAGGNGQFRLIGVNSAMYVTMDRLVDMPYETIHTLFNTLTPPGTDLKYYFKGFEYNSDAGYPADPDRILIQNDKNKDFVDKPLVATKKGGSRIWMSRSNELTQLPSGRIGDWSMKFYVDFSSDNAKTSPLVDTRAILFTAIHNKIAKPTELWGTYLTVKPEPTSRQQYLFKRFPVNSTVENLANTDISGTVYAANTNFITVIKSPNRNEFNIGDTIQNPANTQQQAIIVDTTGFSEQLGNGIREHSRYVSKKVDLAEGFDSEDLKVYLTGYRPVGGDFYVYCKLHNSEDPGSFNGKMWTQMIPVHSDGLRSSQVDSEDFVELEYSMPYTTELSTNNVYANTTTNQITVPSTAEVKAGDYIYFYDENLGIFNVRKIQSVESPTVLQLYTKPSGDCGSSNTSFGVIEGMVNKETAFKFTKNNGIVRYSTMKDKIYETYKSFSIKIVPVATGSHIVPRARDMRAVALQV